LEPSDEPSVAASNLKVGLGSEQALAPAARVTIDASAQVANLEGGDFSGGSDMRDTLCGLPQSCQFKKTICLSLQNQALPRLAKKANGVKTLTPFRPLRARP
jgi:hypothetical protein